jgi:hypothetical protein
MGRLGYRGRAAVVARALVPATPDAPRRRPGRPPVELGLNLVMPVQFFADAGATFRTGEKRLMLAVLADAIHILLRDAAAPGRRRQQLFVEAESWLGSEDGTWPFSFVNVCEALGLNPSYVRQRLARCRTARREPSSHAAAGAAAGESSLDGSLTPAAQAS